MNKKVVVGMLTSIIVLLFVWIVSFSLTESQIQSDKKAKTISTTNSISVKDLEVEMHQMANGLIIAEDGEIWGTKEVNTSNVQKILAEAKSLENDNDGKVLLRIADEWSKRDFSNIISDHNFIWQKLSGNVGKASEVNQEAVNNAVERLQSGE